eukprot:scaffold16.g27.t1
MTDLRVEVECLEMLRIGNERAGLPEQTALIPGPLVQRQVLLHIPDPHSRPYVYATSWWSEATVDQYLRDRSRPIWVSLSEGRAELYREILAVEYGNCPYLEERFQSPGPFWGRQYLFWRGGRPLTLIHEVFSTALQDFLGPMDLAAQERSGSNGGASGGGGDGSCADRAGALGSPREGIAIVDFSCMQTTPQTALGAVAAMSAWSGDAQAIARPPPRAIRDQLEAQVREIFRLQDSSDPRAIRDQLEAQVREIFRLQGTLQHYRTWAAQLQGTGDWPGAGVPPPQVQDKSYAFVEFRSVEEASNAMALDGVLFRENYIRRPNNYDVNMAIMLGPTEPSPALDLAGLEIVRTVVADSPHKLFVGGLPCDWTEDQARRGGGGRRRRRQAPGARGATRGGVGRGGVGRPARVLPVAALPARQPPPPPSHHPPQVKEMLMPFGPLKAFNLVMDRATGNSKGYAFCEYSDIGVTDMVIGQLNGKAIGNKFLTVKRALAPAPHPGHLPPHANHAAAAHHLPPHANHVAHPMHLMANHQAAMF